ncbi:MAG: hypothetical protein KY393_01940, partial [Actinobacteria bacterium]|nr:hypothetical protein [Actinomycetota bacterium]
MRMLPVVLERVPRYGPRLEGTPLPYPFPLLPPVVAGTQPLLGATILAAFDADHVNPSGTYDAIVSEAGKELARGRVVLA